MGSVGCGRAGIYSRVGFVLSVLMLPCALAATPKRVLILDSFGGEVAPYGPVISAFRTALARDLGQPVDISEVSLDMARFGDPAFENHLVDFLEQWFSSRPMDIVVPVGAPAVRFAMQYRGSLFKDTPLVYTGVDARLAPLQFLTNGTTLVAQRLDLRSSIEDMLQLQPATTNVVVILGATPLERFWADEFRREWQVYTNRLGFAWLNDLSLPEIERRVRMLPSRSFIFFGMVMMDANRVPYDSDDALKVIHAAANAPVFGYFRSQLGCGIIGGRLYEQSRVGTAAARVAIRILRGENPDDIPAEILSSSHAAYDWRELRRWGIGPDRLPPDSAIEFREPTFWGRYRRYLIVLTSICVLETGLVFGLVANLAKRRRAEESLRKSREQYALAAEGSNDGLWDWDITGNVVFYSTRWKSMLGYSENEVAPSFSSWEDLLHPADKSRTLNALKACLEGASSTCELEHRLRHKDGSYRWVLARGKLLRDANGRPSRMAGSHTDVTRRKRTEEALRGLSARLIREQEKERSRLARELHDDITQRLARLAIDVGRAEGGAAQSGTQTLGSVREELARLSEDVHALSYRLHPSVLEDLGLGPALRAEAEHFERQSAIPVELGIRDLPEVVPPEAALCIFRVAQEALRNAARHAAAQEISVSLHPADGGLQLAVQDNGCGFDPAVQRDRPSLGHASMRERVRSLGGEFEIESAPGHGTIVLAWVPLKGKST